MKTNWLIVLFVALTWHAAATAKELVQPGDMIAVIGDSTRQAASTGLHEALGFRHVGILQDVGFKHSRWLDTVLMQRALGDGGTTQP